MTASMRDCRFRSDVMRAAWAEGFAEGLAGGQAKAILRVLERRGVAVPDEVRHQVRRCTDLAQLETWLVNAVTVEDVVGG
jgi:hypothetical protein